VTNYEKLLKEYEQVKALEFAPTRCNLDERFIQEFGEKVKQIDKEIQNAKHLLEFWLGERKESDSE